MSFEDAAELKSFAWYMTGCLCLGKLDESKIGVVNFAKARNQETTRMVVQLRGVYATFIKPGNKVQYDPRMQKWSEAGAGDMPKEASAERKDYEGVAEQVKQ